LNLLGGFVEFLKRLGRNGDVEGELEEAFGTFSKLSLEFFSVFELDFGGRVGNAATFNIRLNFGLHFTDFSFKVIHDAVTLNRIDIHGDVERPFKIN